jgi:hypothetical protein
MQKKNKQYVILVFKTGIPGIETRPGFLTSQNGYSPSGQSFGFSKIALLTG